MRVADVTQGFRSVYKPRRAGRGFAELLDAVATVDPELRVRFTSPHPKDFSDDVIEVRKLRPRRQRLCSNPAVICMGSSSAWKLRSIPTSAEMCMFGPS